ncbi:hypothetical protein [Salipiger mangrovisoli]|uniref:Uncharacterized protein n=1 Tax=Salipiger mangrovisoli TaxID=2865933 RepID=A0ABR9X8L8_9RHOB|nr:hypothetical protein [Salipiger mangrovisoli]MBE9639945.1 hypothetical protein [Salipiger mangrovisoli]
MSNIPYGLTGPQYFLLCKLRINNVINFNHGDASILIDKGLARVGASGDLELEDRERADVSPPLRQAMTS